MKNRIVVLLLTCALSSVTKVSFSQSSVMTKYCLLKDTTVVHNGVTFQLYKNTWMLYDTTMKLFYEKSGIIDTLVLDNISESVRGDSIMNVDTLCLSKPNLGMMFKRFKDKESYHDSLVITKTTEDTIFLHVPSIDEPLMIVSDTVICVESCAIDDTVFNGIVASVGDNIPIYYAPLTIETEISTKSNLWVIILDAVIALLAIAGVLVLFLLEKKRHTCISEEMHDTETKTAVEETSENTKSDDTKDDTESGETNNRQPEEDSDKLRKQIANLEERLEEKEKKLDVSEKQVSELNKQVSELKKEHKENIEKEKAKKDKEFAEERAKLNRRISELQAENKTIEDKVRKEMQKKVENLNDELNQKKKMLSETQNDLTTTKDNLEKTKSRLKKEEQNVATLKEAQKQYTDKLTFTPWASDYSKKIAALFDVVDKVVKGANKLMSVDVADPYLIAKALANYEMNIGSIDMPRFSAEVFMAANKQMAFNESGIVNLATVEEKSRPRLLRRYYIDEYLKKYIKAIVVLNESLAGVHRLIPDLPESATKTFGEYRAELNKCFSELEIKVISVKLFDKVTNNVDLKVTEIDYDTAIPADSILEITNCIVYAADADRPSEKIYVKAQK